MGLEVFVSRAGGGRNQGMRCALCLSALTGEPVKMAGLVGEGVRPRPGLALGAQSAVEALARIIDGRVELNADATELFFEPGAAPPGGSYEISLNQDPRLAVPLSDLVEILAPTLARAQGDTQVFMEGATHIPAGLSGGVLKLAHIPNLKSGGLLSHYLEITPGFLPSGRGEAELSMAPSLGLRPINAVAPFKPWEVRIEVLLSGLPVHLGEQAMQAANDRLKLHNLKARGNIRRASAASGMALTLAARSDELTMAFASLGRRGGRPEALAVTAVEQLMAFLKSGAAVHSRLAAPLIPLMAAAPGVSRITVENLSPGLRAALLAVEAFFPGSTRADLPGQGEPARIVIRGQDL